MKDGTRSFGGWQKPLLRIAIGALISVPLLNASRKVAPVRSDQTAREPGPAVKSAIDGVLDLFNHKSVVAIGDDHNLAQQEEFYSALVRDPRFAQNVGNVVVEFGGEASQSIIDRYVDGVDVPLGQLRRVWTETAGWIPGPTSLGYVNFFVSVRNANSKLPVGRRIRVWLGDPSIDWSKINSFRDLQPYLAARDANFSRLLSDEILTRQKKTLLIIGTQHLFGPNTLGEKIQDAYPGAMAIVSPFTGYIEPECNAKFVEQASDWPVPAVAVPVDGTSLKSELLLPGCNYIPPDELQRMRGMANTPLPPGVRWVGPGKPPSPSDMIEGRINAFSGAKADAILYLGPPDAFMESPIDPDIYLDSDYLKEENRRRECCVLGSKPLDLD